MNRFNRIVFTGTKKLIQMGGLDCFRASGLHKSIRNYNITSKTFSKTHQHLLFGDRGDDIPSSLVFKALSPKVKMGWEEAQVISVTDGVTNHPKLNDL